jgi:HEAT repeat protein
MFMRTPNAAWKTVCAISVFGFMFQLTTTGQQAGQDSRLERLLSSDAATRGSAKAELVAHPDPALLPALLKALPSSKGTNRDDIFEVLAKYDDPRKIPVFLALQKSTPSDTGTGTAAIEEQLSRLGAPAAEALLANCPGHDSRDLRGGLELEDYARWAAGILSWMHETGAQFLIEAVQSDDSCKHSVGEQGLFYMFGEADREANEATRADIELAADAAIHPDERIRGAARRWFASLKGKEENADFSGIVEALIAAYQANAPPETMVKIADMLSQRERPRVTRFMRAAVHAPNPEIQRIANQYLAMFVPTMATQHVRVNSNPRTPKQKIAFLGQLTNSQDYDVNPEIVPFLSDPDPNVRAAAAERLGDVNAPSTSPREEGVADPANALPALRDAVKDSSPKVRAAAVKALGEMRSYADVELLIAASKDTDELVVVAAMEALREIPNDSAVSVLTEIYRNENNSLERRNQVVLTLETICNPDSVPIFLEDLQSGGTTPSTTAAMALECALKKRPDPSAYAPILKMVQSPVVQPGWVLLQSSLIRALGDTKNTEALAPLTELLKSSIPDVRRSAVDALGSLGDARAIPVLAALLKDGDYQLRVSAASALTRFSDFSAPPELIAALADADTTVQSLAAKALVSSKDPKAMDALLAAMAAAHPVAIYALGESHEPRAVPALIAFFKNAANKSAERASAAASLGKLSDIRAVDPLIASLNEDNFTITMSASSALGQLKDKRAIEPLKQAYTRWSTGQRENADSVKGFIVTALLQLGVTDVIKK